MAYDEYLAERVKLALSRKGVRAEAKRLMGGLCFVLNDKMCVGVSKNKKTGQSGLIARIGDSAVQNALENQRCHTFSPAGRPMKDFIFIEDQGLDQEAELDHWVELAIAFNPKAKKSRK
ncbi:MAG: TfoX/Sxy family protein [Reichenbachiella sp.]|uniref:TfoX/Sxy family protein n=1 Tax=Reichenbachiella sp. TaxID=2184521 RepID=UPI003264C361